MKDVEKFKELLEEIKKLNFEYEYDLEWTIDSTEWDRMKKELKEKEQELINIYMED